MFSVKYLIIVDDIFHDELSRRNKKHVITKTKLLSQEVVVSNTECETGHYCGVNISYTIINRIHI